MPPNTGLPPRRLKAAILLPAAALTGLAATGPVRSAPQSTAAKAGYPDTVHHCRVMDGDTLRRDGGRVRLLGIDAPELPGHCARGRVCAPGDPVASARSLRIAMGDGTVLAIRRVGIDRYGRTLALIRERGGDLSCWQLAHRQAIYKPAWDNDDLVASTCPAAAR